MEHQGKVWGHGFDRPSTKAITLNDDMCLILKWMVSEQENGNNMFGMHQANDIFYGFSGIEKSDYSIAGDKFELVVRGEITAPVSYESQIGENFLFGYLHDARNSGAYHRGYVKFDEC